VVTALVHVVLQVTDYRPLMLAAYSTVSSDGEYAYILTQATNTLNTAEFYRALPQGTTLMLFFAVLYTARYCLMGKFSQRQLSVILLLVGALAITFTRSILASLIAGVTFALVLASWARAFRVKMAMRLVAIITLCFASGVVYETIHSGFWGYWTQRIEELSGADSQVFSADNQTRGVDNVASLNAIRDHPFIGLGTPRYPADYSLRFDPATDIHPMLQIGLVGGIPAILLVVWLQVSIIWHFAKRIRRHWRTGSGVTPFLAVLCMSALVINAIGGGGTLLGTGILALSVFTVEMARQECTTNPVPTVLPWPSTLKRKHA
jgi:O-antigen ligase